MAVHTIEANGAQHVLNFNSYAVMQCYRKYGADGLERAMANDPFSFLFDMLKFGLSDNGRKEWQDADVYDLIDGMGGITSDVFVNVSTWMKEAFEVPVSKKKETETAEAQ